MTAIATAVTVEEHTGSVMIGFTKYDLASINTAIEAFGTAIAAYYTAVDAATEALKPHLYLPDWGFYAGTPTPEAPEAAVKLYEALQTYVRGTIELGNKRQWEKYPVATWRKETKSVEAITRRIVRLTAKLDQGGNA